MIPHDDFCWVAVLRVLQVLKQVACSVLQALSGDWLGITDRQQRSDDDAGDDDCENDDENGGDCHRDFQTEVRSRSRQKSWKREWRKHGMRGWRL
jgi:hypothetical protein